MAPNTNVGPTGQQTTNLSDLTQGLEKELRLRTVEGANGSSPPSTATALAHTLANCLSNLQHIKTSPRSTNTSNRTRGNFPGRSSSQSSDSSISAGCHSAMEVEKQSTAPTSSLTAAREVGGRSYARSSGNAGTQAPTFDTQAKGMAVQAAESGELRPHSNRAAPSGPGGKSGLCASASVGASTGKVAKNGPKRRSRVSKKPPTKTIEAGPEAFREMVQQLTGCQPSAAAHGPSGSFVQKERGEFGNSRQSGGRILRPQPQRPGNSPIDIDTHSQGPPMRLVAPPALGTVGCISPVSQAPVVSFPYRESNSSAACSSFSGLNYCMGYDQSSTMFAELYPGVENLGMVTCNPDATSDLFCSSEFMVMHTYNSSQEPHSTSGSPTDPCLGMPLPEDTNRRHGASREITSISGETRISSSDHISKTPISEHLVPKHPHGQMANSMESGDIECTAKTENEVDSWIQSSSDPGYFRNMDYKF